ncbi:MAG: hypothetical protein LIP01_15970 [Tannerellaceae bacterium]|nr:hypothetical protein [Tannerellaceae bacterium]
MRGSKLDDIMTLLFMLLAIASVVVLFIANTRTAFLGIAGVAVILRIIQYILRFIKK